jgi:hypothetical protein
VAQVAVSLLLLVGAGLFIRTMYNLQRVNLGFNQENLLLFALQPEQGGYKDERLVQFYNQLFERLDNLPGVRSATFGRIPLISHYMYNTGLLLPGETESTGADTSRPADDSAISRLGGPAFSGRTTAGLPRSSAYRQSNLRDKFFPDQDVLGLKRRDGDGKRDSKQGVFAAIAVRSIEPLLYTPWRQEGEEIGEMYFALRTAGDPALVSPTDRSRHGHPPVTNVVSQTTRAGVAQERLYARLLSFCRAGAVAAAIDCRECWPSVCSARMRSGSGWRGAQPANVLRMVVWRGTKLCCSGGGRGVERMAKALMASQYFGRTRGSVMADSFTR